MSTPQGSAVYSGSHRGGRRVGTESCAVAVEKKHLWWRFGAVPAVSLVHAPPPHCLRLLEDSAGDGRRGGNKTQPAHIQCIALHTVPECRCACLLTTIPTLALKAAGVGLASTGKHPSLSRQCLTKPLHMIASQQYKGSCY